MLKTISIIIAMGLVGSCSVAVQNGFIAAYSR